MKECKTTLEQINIKGINITDEVKAHLAGCQSCDRAYKEIVELENFLLASYQMEPPENLKYSILSRIYALEEKKPGLSVFQKALRMAGAMFIIALGFWMGSQTANRGSKEIENDYEILRFPIYKLNTNPLMPENLSKIYFKVIEEMKNEE